MDRKEHCLICRREVHSAEMFGVKLDAGGVDALIKESEKKRDLLNEYLTDVKEGYMHRNCKSDYFNERRSQLAVTAAESRRRNKRIYLAKKFDFKNFCFFCNGDIKETEKTDIDTINSQEMLEVYAAQVNLEQQNEHFDTIKIRLSSLLTKNDGYFEKNPVNFHSKCSHIFSKYRPPDVDGIKTGAATDFFSYCVYFLEKDCHRCQFRLQTILKAYSKKYGIKSLQPYFLKTTERLKEHYQEEIVVYDEDSPECIINLKNSLAKNDKLKLFGVPKDLINRKDDIIQLAAHFILEDIRAEKYGTNCRPGNVTLLKAGKDLPKSLRTFFNTLINSHKKNEPNAEKQNLMYNKITTLGHILISAVRPESYASSLMLSISTLIEKKLPPKELITHLHNIGLCASYSDTIDFQDILHGSDVYKYNGQSCIQFVFDDFDEPDLVSGSSYLGGIMCVKPAPSICMTDDVEIDAKEIKTLPISNTMDYKFDKKIRIEDLEKQNYAGAPITIKSTDLLWFLNKSKQPTFTGWHAFKSACYNSKTNGELTKVYPFPFVQVSKTPQESILTVLIEAKRRSNLNNQSRCFVTFQPRRYVQAMEIIAGIDPEKDLLQLHTITVNLGTHQVFKSYLKAIGYVMKNSGLREAISTIYTEEETDDILLGNDFARAIRAHSLIQLVIAHKILDYRELNADEISLFKQARKLYAKNDKEIIHFEQLLREPMKKFMGKLESFGDSSETGKLWIQYFKFVLLMKRFIEAEREGGFRKKVDTLYWMTPILYAVNHTDCAKATHLFVQTMLQKRRKSPKKVFEQIYYLFNKLKRGYAHWSGVAPDRLLEQTLKRSLQVSKKNFLESALTSIEERAEEIFCKMKLLELRHETQLFCGIKFEELIDSQNPQGPEHDIDISKLKKFFAYRDIFIKGPGISSIGSNNMYLGGNTNDVINVGKDIMKKITICTFDQLPSEQNNYDNSIFLTASMSKKLKGILAYAPQEIHKRFKRIKTALPYDTRMLTSHELSSVPLALFDETGMRKADSNEFYDNFQPNTFLTTAESMAAKSIVDGDYLLWKVDWMPDLTMKQIIETYANYVLFNFRETPRIIFTDYPENDLNTENMSVNHSRRQFFDNSNRELSNFKDYMDKKCPLPKHEFLKNEKNKIQLIKMLCEDLEEKELAEVKFTYDDIQFEMVEQALVYARQSKVPRPILLIGYSIDALVILVQLGAHLKDDLTNIYFRREKKEAYLYYNYKCLKNKELDKIIALLYIFTGCSTTSAFYKKSKNQLQQIFSIEKLKKLAAPFYRENTNVDELYNAAYTLITGIYGNEAELYLREKMSNFSLNDLRYLMFCRNNVIKTGAFDELPPTEGAAKEHALRTYYQLQKWTYRKVTPTDWGWINNNGYLVPVLTKELPFPADLPELIACKCADGCSSDDCNCAEGSVFCCFLCPQCTQNPCENTDPNTVESEGSDKDSDQDED